jgi:hypothetical protein
VPGKRITIIPRVHGKVTRERKLSEPDIDWILERWLERHPEVRAGSRMSLAAQTQAVLAHT